MDYYNVVIKNKGKYPKWGKHKGGLYIWIYTHLTIKVEQPNNQGLKEPLKTKCSKNLANEKPNTSKFSKKLLEFL